MDDVRGDFLGLPHGTTQAAVIANKNKNFRSFKSSEHINEKGDGPYHGFGLHQSLLNMPLNALKFADA